MAKRLIWKRSKHYLLNHNHAERMMAKLSQIGSAIARRLSLARPVVIAQPPNSVSVVLRVRNADHLEKAFAKMQGELSLDTTRKDGNLSIDSTEPTTKQSSPITPSETQVVQQLANGFLIREIAKMSYRSEETIKSHIKSAKAKLAADTTPHMIAIAFREGLIG